MKTFENSAPTLFDGMELPTSTSSVAGSHARTLASLENDLASKVRDLVSGRSTQDLLANFDQDSLSWRTYQVCFLSEWESFSGTFPRSGMMRSGTVSRLPPSAPLINGTGSGWWPTPVASDANSFARVTDAMTFRRTSSGRPRKISHNGVEGSVGLSRAVQIEAFLRGEEVGALNPLWVEWLMGFPINWTGSEPLETALSHGLQNSLAESSLPEPSP